MNKVLIDTNVLVYSKDISSVHHQAAISTLSPKDEFYCTSKNLIEYYAVVTKGERPLLSSNDALGDLKEFSNQFIILYPNIVSKKILLDLIHNHHPKGLKVHDFEIASIALANNIYQIATFDATGLVPKNVVK